MAIDALWLQNVDYPARIDRVVYDSIWTEGILGAGSFLVTPNAPVGMSVRVAAGIGVVTGDDQVFQGKYLCREQVPLTTLPITAAPGSGSRHDLIILQVRDPNATGPAGNDAIFGVVTGTPSGSPVDPVLPASSLLLGRVRVPAGTGSITSGLIDDLRVVAVNAYDTIPNASITASKLSAGLISSLVPTGTITAFGGTTAPSGWLLCDGSAYATITYPDLFTVIGNQYDASAGQASPGAGNFRVPIMQGRVPVGRDVGQVEFDAMGETGGVKTVTLTSGQSGLVGHTHTVTATGTSDPNNANHSHGQTGTFTTGGQSVNHDHGGATTFAGTHDHSMDIGSASTGTHGHANAANSATAAGQPVNQTSSGNDSDQINNAGSHQHSFLTATNSVGHDHSVTVSGSTGTQSANHAHDLSVSGSAAAVASANAVNAHDNLSPYIVTTYIIKT